ncbi:hypothetical protein E2C01_067526 [Portunus trituberculatus]|uniref:Uncharacterized protein n=1 Tax=Portunus trituberculatus TaxID=210409 RepID=A0A5B7HTV0_PORTR|nr:hypothetical protein [Portunus trituberculatus]
MQRKSSRRRGDGADTTTSMMQVDPRRPAGLERRRPRRAAILAPSAPSLPPSWPLSTSFLASPCPRPYPLPGPKHAPSPSTHLSTLPAPLY